MARQFLFGSPTDVLVKESSNNSMTDYFFPWTTNFNSFVLLTFDKTVILEVSRTGTINLALRPDVYGIIAGSLESAN